MYLKTVINKKLYFRWGCFAMATSSITKNFIITEPKQVEMFADAIEASAQNRPIRIPVSSREIADEAELLDFMEKWERVNLGNR